MTPESLLQTGEPVGIKTKRPVLKPLALATSALVWCAVNLHAQSGPTITNQPASQTVLAGSSVTFNVAVDGTGPFTYQWQFNGTNLPNNIITTVAGNGSATFSGDGGPATNASLYNPRGAALDASGNLFIADLGNNRIRKVDINGIITTVAGNGSATYGGDGGPATNAGLDCPTGVALDAADKVYIIDYNDSRIRKVDINGIITTVAGNGSLGYSGDGGAATNASLALPSGVVFDAAGNLYIADSDNQRIRKVDTNGIITTVAGNGSASYGGDGGAATNASLNGPFGVALDAAGNLFIGDEYNQRIRKVDTNGIISTVAGNGSAGYSGDGGTATNASLYYPCGVALDAAGNLYIGDYYNNRIRKVDTDDIITTVAGNGSAGYSGDGGAATNASLYYPFGVALDAVGNLYIADQYNHRICEVHFAGFPTLALTNVNTNNAGNYTVVITSPYGSVTSAVAVLTVVLPPSILVQPASQGVLTGSVATISVTATGTPPLYYSWYFNATNLVQSGTNSTLTLPAVSTNDAGSYMVVVSNAYGILTSQVATLTAGFPPSLTNQPASQTVLAGTNVTFNVTVNGTGPFTYQWQFNGINLPNNIITTMAGNGSATYAGDGGAAIYASLHNPTGVAFDAAGNLLIGDHYNNRIRRVDVNGTITTVAGNGSGTYAGDGSPATNASLYYPYGVTLDTTGNLYIADTDNNRIRKVDINGIITTVAGNGSSGYSGDGGTATNASLYYPCGVALDAAGSLYIVDQFNYRIRKVDANGIITTVAGNGSGTYAGDGSPATNASLYYPSGAALDAAGNLFVADTYNNRIRKVDTNGIITTVAGNGSGTYAGDGGAATNASLYYPSDIAFDSAGNLYIADYNNQRIRRVDTNGIITTVAGNGSGTYAGDGGAATNASLKAPFGVAFDAAGNLYIADTYNNRIREVHFAGYPTLSLTNASTNDAGNYSVVITSPYGSVTSAMAALTVVLPPSILVQPASQTVVMPGSNATISVTASGAPPLYYSWYLNATNLVQSGTNSALTLPAVSTQNAGNYTVVVTNCYGSVTSQVAILTVTCPPTVTTQPASQAVFAGTNVSFSVAVDGSGPFTYQWRLNGTNLSNLPKVITTVAGSGASGFSGDGGPATNAALFGPNAATVDAFGNIFIADWNNNRVRKVTTNGVITTVAGNGSTGGSINGRAATNTAVYHPASVVADPAGNLFISENGANIIARVGTNGIITNVVGTSLNSPFGIALDAFGNLFIADMGNHRIREMGTNGIITTVAGSGVAGFAGDGGAATNAKLYAPWGVFLDSSGNLFISDTGNNRIREVGTNGIITTIAGNGSAGFSGDGGVATNAGLQHPDAVALDAFGNLLIADAYNNRIRQVDTGGTITTVAGGGTDWPGDGGLATSARLIDPSCVAVDAIGNIFVDDNLHNRIRVLVSGPSLLLTNVGTTNAGDYTVIITNPYGSVTSAVATLTVTIPRTQPQILTSGAGFGFLTNQFGFNISGAFGQTIVVDGSTNLADWIPLSTNTVGGSPIYFFDPAWTNFPWRFYRGRLQ